MTEKIPSIGTLTDRIDLRKRGLVEGAAGGHEAFYVPLGSVWARVRALSGRRDVAADGRGVEISHSVVLRFRGDVEPGDRIVYRGRNLDVVSAGDLNGRRAYLSCRCSETSFTG